MKIYLAQHGKSYSEDLDPERNLTQEGKDETIKMAQFLNSSKIQVNSIIHSGKTRAKQTAEYFNKYLKPTHGLLEMPGLNPNDSVIEFSKKINEENTLYVGHLPFMENLVAYLVTGVEDNKIFQFQNSSVVCLEKKAGSKYFIIKWAFVPQLD